MTSVANMTGLLSGATIHSFLWIEARDRTTGAAEGVGVWTGLTARAVVIDGETRTYQAGGSLVSLPDITSGEGLDVRSHQFELSRFTPEFVQAVKVYDPRLARVSLHEGYAHPDTDELYDTPELQYRGILDELTIPEDERGSAVLTVLSNLELLTRTLADKKSDEGQKIRLTATGAPDRFRKYASVSGSQGDWWGQYPPENEE